MRKLAALLTVSTVVLGSGCQLNQTMWSGCDPQGGPFGLDGTGPNALVLYCDNGEWVPKLTAQEFVDIRAGKAVVIAPVPARPTAPTTTAPRNVSAPVLTGMFLGGGPADYEHEWTDVLEGVNLSEVTEVLVDGESVEFQVLSQWPIEALGIWIPKRGQGTVDITVKNAGGSATLSNAYTYHPSPTITSTNYDPVTGDVELLGTNFNVPFRMSRDLPRTTHAVVQVDFFNAQNQFVDGVSITPNLEGSTKLTFTVDVAAITPGTAVSAQWRVLTLGGPVDFELLG